MQLLRYEQFCFSETSLFAEITVWLINWRSMGESCHPDKVSETLGSCDNYSFTALYSLLIVFSLLPQHVLNIHLAC